MSRDDNDNGDANNNGIHAIFFSFKSWQFTIDTELATADNMMKHHEKNILFNINDFSQWRFLLTAKWAR